MLYRSRHILLVAGIIAVILFLVLSGKIYFRLYLGNPAYTDGLYQFRYTIRFEGIVMRLALMTVGLSWGVAAVYYYLINSVRFDRWWHWAAVAVIVTVAGSAIGYSMVSSGLDRVEPGLSAEYSDLNMLLQVWTALLAFFWFVVASFSIRWWSSNCRHTPIPQ